MFSSRGVNIAPKTIESNLAIAENLKELEKGNRSNTKAITLMLNELSNQLTWVEAKSYGITSIPDEKGKAAIKEAFRRSEERSQRVRERIEEIFKE